MSRSGVLLFAAMCVIWGIPYLMIRVAVRELAPVTLVFFRTALAAVLLLPFALWRKELRALLPHWRALLLYTGIEVALPVVPAREGGDPPVELADGAADRRGSRSSARWSPG